MEQPTNPVLELFGEGDTLASNLLIPAPLAAEASAIKQMFDAIARTSESVRAAMVPATDENATAGPEVLRSLRLLGAAGAGNLEEVKALVADGIKPTDNIEYAIIAAVMGRHLNFWPEFPEPQSCGSMASRGMISHRPK